MPEDSESKSEAELRKAWAKAMKEAEAEQQRKAVLRRFLDDASYGRMMNIRASNPELYLQLAELIISLVQSNRLSGKITEAQFLQLLRKLTYRPEPTISFKHK
ncbi:MAG: DNA-binding protein [Candidatus Micrarchaeaceae archaeon]